MKIHSPRTENAIKQKIRDLVHVPISRLSRITAQFAFVEMQLLQELLVHQTAIPFHDDEVSRLYVDYRPRTNFDGVVTDSVCYRGIYRLVRSLFDDRRAGVHMAGLSLTFAEPDYFDLLAPHVVVEILFYLR